MTTGEQLHRTTENVYRNVIDGFAPEVRTLIAQGKVYDKALQGVTQAAKEYFDAIVRIGELASDTKGARQLGQSLLQIAETYRQIEAERDAVVHSLRKELLLPMENKIDEWKSITQNQKAYLSENKSKAETVEKRRSEVKKLQKKTQKNHSEKYLDKEQKSIDNLQQLSKQLLSFRTSALRDAWCEQRKRYAFLVERYCGLIKNEAAFYGKAQSVLQFRHQKWNESCEKPYKLPEECEEMLSMDFSGPLESPLHIELRNSMKMIAKVREDSSGSDKSQSRPVSLASQEMERPLSVEVESQSPQPTSEQEQFPLPQQSGYVSATLPNRGKAGGLRYTKSMMHHSPGGSLHGRPTPQRHLSDNDESDKSLPKVRGIYNHPANGESQLGFQEGDIIGLVGPRNNGWYFGHNYRTRRNGWFPIAFTIPLENGHPNGSVVQPPPMGAPNMQNNPNMFRQPQQQPQQPPQQQPQQPPQQQPQQQQHQQYQPQQNLPQQLSMKKGMSVSSENLSGTNENNYPSPDYLFSDAPQQQTVFKQTPPPPPSQTSRGLLMAANQQQPQQVQPPPPPVQQSLSGSQLISGSQPSLVSQLSSGSQPSSGSATPLGSSAANTNGHELEPPQTPTHPPPPPPTSSPPPVDENEDGDDAANPLLNVQLRRTVTNDRSAPQIPQNYSLN